MLKLKNSPKSLLRLNFTGYAFDREKVPEILAWLEISLSKGDYYGMQDSVIFLRHPSAEMMLKLKFHDSIIKEYRNCWK